MHYSVIMEMISVRFFKFMYVCFFHFRKVYVQFAMDRTLSTVQMGNQQAVVSVPGRISKEVYKAVRRRQLGMECQIPALPYVEFVFINFHSLQILQCLLVEV